MTRCACFIVVLCIAGCGPHIPDDFTVSGLTLDHWLEALRDGRPETRARAVRALSNVGPDVPAVVPDPSRTKSVLGWSAKVSFAETIERMLSWYDAHGVSDIYSHLSAAR